MSDTKFQSSSANMGLNPVGNDLHTFPSQVLGLLERMRGISIEPIESTLALQEFIASSLPPFRILTSISSALRNASKDLEAATIDQVLEKVVDKKAFGGLGLGANASVQPSDYENVLDLTEAWLESLNSQDRAKNISSTVEIRSTTTRPMNLAQKIFAYHVVGGCPVEGLATGDVVRVAVDWILASELSWRVSWPM